MNHFIGILLILIAVAVALPAITAAAHGGRHAPAASGGMPEACFFGPGLE